MKRASYQVVITDRNSLMSKHPFLVMLALLLLPAVTGYGAAEGSFLEPRIAQEIATTLAGRKVAPPPVRTRGGDLESLYRASVVNVPVVISEGGIGSSAVIRVETNQDCLLITNHHVVKKAFLVEGLTSVLVLFYDPELKNESFDGQRLGDCLRSSNAGTLWCRAVRRSIRIGTVLRADEARDLALVSVPKPPANVTGFKPGSVSRLQPGSSVAAIGHPTGLLWTFTTGIISAIRTNFSLGNGLGTLIQTQTPINPGNSGGPLVTMDGNVAGIVFAKSAGVRLNFNGEELTMPTEGLNYAIGIDTTLSFVNCPAEAGRTPAR